MQRRVPILLTLTMLVAAAAADAQTAALAGTVTDAQGNGLPGVTVTLAGPAPAAGTCRDVTRRDGWYRVTVVSPGLYGVTFELQGYAPLRYERVRLQLGETVTLRVTLDAATTAAARVDGVAPPYAEVMGSAPQKHVTPAVLASVPFPTRTGAEAIALAPGVHPLTSMLYSRNGRWSDARVLDVLSFPGGVANERPDAYRLGPIPFNGARRLSDGSAWRAVANGSVRSVFSASCSSSV